MRLTRKKFLEFVNEQLTKHKINFIATDVLPARQRPCDIESGACRLIVTIRYQGENADPLLLYQYFYCFYTIKEFEDHIKCGYEMYLKLNSRLYSDMEIDLRKPPAQKEQGREKAKEE